MYCDINVNIVTIYVAVGEFAILKAVFIRQGFARRMQEEFLCQSGIRDANERPLDSSTSRSEVECQCEI